MKTKPVVHERGFTVMEMVIVIGIATLLAAIVLPNILSARANSRDKSRITDIASLTLAMQLEKEAVNSLPANATAVEIGTNASSSLDSIIRLRIGRLPADPKASNPSYGYFYKNPYSCKGVNQAVIYIQAFEALPASSGDCDSGPYAKVIPSY